MVGDNGRILHRNRTLVKYLKNSGFDEPMKPLDAALTTSLGEDSTEKFQIFFKGDK